MLRVFLGQHLDLPNSKFASDGWCIQFGEYVNTVDGWTTIPFLKTYKQIPNVRIQRHSSSTSDDSSGLDRRHTIIRNITLTGFNAWGVWAGYKFLWTASGYIN